MMSLRTRFLLAGLAALSLVPPSLAQDRPRKDPAAAEAVNLVFLGDTRPVLLRLHVLIDGKTISAHWNDYIAKWFHHLDGDGDGVLDAAEVARAPSDAAMVGLLRQGGFPRLPLNTLRMSDLKKNADDKVTLAELQDYYRRLVGPVELVPQPAAAGAAEASDALFKALDTNKDGKLSRDELKAALTSLRKLDLDDDEWITLQELSPNVANPFVRGGGAGLAPVEQASDVLLRIRPDDNRVALLLLARYDRDSSRTLSRKELGLDEMAFAAIDANQDGQLDVEELFRWHERAADLEFTVKMGKVSGVAVELNTRVKTPFTKAAMQTAPGAYQITFPDAQIQLARNNDVIRTAGRAGVGQFLLQQFRLADTKKNGFLEMKELAGGQLQILQQVFPVVDRNRDGKMTEKELQGFIELLDQASDCFVMLLLGDQGRAMFQLLDANRDGRLSPRELLTAWDRLAPLGRKDADTLNAGDIARQFQINVQQGQVNTGFVSVGGFPGNPQPPPRVPLGNAVPEWFRKMDKSGDGYVSSREFLGTRDDFLRIDTDADTLISPEEATRYDEQVRPRNAGKR